MSAHQELAGILERWLQLTREEATAIQSAAWPNLSRIQTRKAGLRQSFEKVAPLCGQEPFRKKVGRIISLLTRNEQALAAQLRQTRAQRVLLDETRRNLRKIRGSYMQPRPLAAWHTYS